ncbi:hypothetical protein GobsT_67570 [Gemmata obscuriglobus]|uniref:TIGR02996 domain-containing protein n=1 Tax=Gemmata obscuriglobus TaxID=114 RepID=A0A2Z3GSS6_9BACT|nr:TIGR02996 domain-containing protein [Gemmata obscuriglobus]AWM35571.1 TIGR02996 domain-containing protein [Gemmata obscuriglobus]QEG31910.1 hypothetical protein GobsT_67570 [Gemmata obscuriglobus]VTS11256.1 Uncharacterized protein OS=Gordonia bronchialis (strain ATCC 25592 / DSM 43247 / JCM 3198 / NCTC 10667) GN=Gbro_3760 PE=4 SV=1 [Gemmata obscuriglobus UQM 2246]
MFTDDDVAFQRALLANPADTTLKLVYADWLQDRADPRAEFVRLQVQLAGLIDSSAGPQAAGVFGTLGDEFEPAWTAFMTTLAQPFAPVRFQHDDPPHPFAEAVGTRGRVVTFGSQFCAPDEWDEGLLADLAFLTGVEWGECCYGAADCPMYGFVCQLEPGRHPLTGRDVIDAVRAGGFRSDHIDTLDATAIPYPGYHPHTLNDEVHTDFADQCLFNHETAGAEDAGAHGALKGYVRGRLWYVLLHAGGWPCGEVTLLAVGHSPHGDRLVGAITSQVCHNLCD